MVEEGYVRMVGVCGGVEEGGMGWKGLWRGGRGGRGCGGVVGVVEDGRGL